MQVRIIPGIDPDECTLSVLWQGGSNPPKVTTVCFSVGDHLSIAINGRRMANIQPDGKMTTHQTIHFVGPEQNQIPELQQEIADLRLAEQHYCSIIDDMRMRLNTKRDNAIISKLEMQLDAQNKTLTSINARLRDVLGECEPEKAKPQDDFGEASGLRISFCIGNNTGYLYYASGSVCSNIVVSKRVCDWLNEIISRGVMSFSNYQAYINVRYKSAPALSGRGQAFVGDNALILTQWLNKVLNLGEYGDIA